MRLQWVLVLATLGLGACHEDPTFDVTITVDPDAGVAGEQLAVELEAMVETPGGMRPKYEVRVSVIDPIAAGEGLVPVRPATCDDIAYGRIPGDVIDGARRASATAVTAAQLSGVPREGNKLVVVDARTRGGHRIAGGCVLAGTVATDTVVEVPVRVAPSVQVFGRQEGTAPSSVTLLLTAPWDPMLVVGRHPITTEAHAAGMVRSVVDDSDERGRYETPVLQAPDGEVWSDGPAQTLLRVKWAEEVLRIPSFRAWPTIATANPIALAPSTTPGFSPHWAFRNASLGEDRYRFAAALQDRVDAEVLVVEYVRSTGELNTMPVPVVGAQALAFFGPLLVTVIPGAAPEDLGRWRGLDANGMPVGWGPAEDIGAATQIHTVIDCDGNADDARMLVRHGDNAPYTAYLQPGEAALAPDPMAVIAARLNSNGENLFGSACLTLDDGSASPPQKQVVLSRGGGLGLIARMVDRPDDDVIIPDVSTAATFSFVVPGAGSIESRFRILAVGAEATISGPRARSTKLTELPISSTMTVTGFVSDGRVDTPLATLPTSLDVFDVDHDGAYDLVAVLPTSIGSRLQVNLGELVGGEPLAAVTDILEGGRRSSNAIVRFHDVDGVGPSELIVASDAGLKVFCVTRDALSPDRPAGSARCVH